MKKILQWAMVLTLSTAVTHCSRDEAQAINGTNGKNGSTILSGTTAPTLNIGEIGDYYLNKSTYDLYGPKTSDSWGTPINLKGREGSNGTAGSKIHAGTGIPAQNIGNNGDWYIDTQNKMLYGPKTDQGWGSGLSLGNGNSSSLRGNYVLSRDGKTLLQWFNKETTQIDMQSDPELKEVTNITNWVFHNYNHTSPHNFSLTNIILPDNLERIGNYTFTYNKLTNITIPNKVTTIGDFAFHSNNLTNAIISGAKTIGKEAFSNNQLISVTIPNSVKSIEEGAFSSNRLTNISIPNSVTSIENSAFTNNPITNIIIPESVTSIGGNAFSHGLAYAEVLSITMTVHATTPPVIKGELTFAWWNQNKHLVKIYVPAGSLTAYKTAEGWKEYASQIYAQ